MFAAAIFAVVTPNLSGGLVGLSVSYALQVLGIPSSKVNYMYTIILYKISSIYRYSTRYSRVELFWELTVSETCMSTNMTISCFEMHCIMSLINREIHLWQVNTLVIIDEATVLTSPLLPKYWPIDSWCFVLLISFYENYYCNPNLTTLLSFFISKFYATCKSIVCVDFCKLWTIYFPAVGNQCPEHVSKTISWTGNQCSLSGETEGIFRSGYWGMSHILHL